MLRFDAVKAPLVENCVDRRLSSTLLGNAYHAIRVAHALDADETALRTRVHFAPDVLKTSRIL
jgi:hypothetical protein